MKGQMFVEHRMATCAVAMKVEVVTKVARA